MAKVEARDLGRLVSGGFKAYCAVLVHGSDAGAIRETVDRLVAAATGPDADPLNHISLDSDAVDHDPGLIADEMRAFSMFGGFRVVHVRGAAKAPPKLIEALADEHPKDALLILEAGDIKKDHALKKLGDRHRAIASIACYADAPRNLSQLVDEMLAEHGLTISREARTLLVSALGADRSLSRSELDKLALYAMGEPSIGIEMVADIVSDAGRHDAGQLVDHAFCGHLPLIEPEANRVFTAGNNSSGVLSIAISQAFLFRRALRGDAQDVFRAGRMHFSRIAPLERALSRWTEARLTRALSVLSDAMLQSRRTPRLANEIVIRAMWTVGRLAGAQPE